MIRAQAGKLCHCLRHGKLHLRRVRPVADNDRAEILRADRAQLDRRLRRWHEPRVLGFLEDGRWKMGDRG